MSSDLFEDLSQSRQIRIGLLRELYRECRFVSLGRTFRPIRLRDPFEMESFELGDESETSP